MVAHEHRGTLRMCVRPLGDRCLSLQWICDETQDIIWTEMVNVPEDRGFVSQIVGTGTFRPHPGYFLDLENKRHFVIAAEPGKLGALAK